MGQSAAHINTLDNIKGQGLIHVVDLINGKMRGPKIHQCIKRMEYINKKSSERATPSDTKLGQGSRLAGFIEADVNFKYERV